MVSLHPVHALRVWLLVLIGVSYVVPYYTTSTLGPKARCVEIMENVNSLWERVVAGCVIFLLADILGCIVLHRKNSSTRWWGRMEKTVVRGTLILLWFYDCYMLYCYLGSLSQTKFRCWSGPFVLTLMGLSIYWLILPLWVILQSDDSVTGRYLPKEDLEDELENMEENPKTYQVWKNGFLLYASMRKSDVRRWVSSPNNLSKDDLSNTVVREIQF